MLDQQQNISANQQEEQSALEEILSFLEEQLLQHKNLKTLKSQKLEKSMQFLLFVQDNQNSKINYVVKAQPIINQHNRKADNESISQIKNQIQCLKNLKHTCIAEVSDEFIIDYFHFIIFSSCNSSLSNQVQENSSSQISDNQICELAEQLIDVVDYLHKNYFVLNEVSLDKILVGNFNNIKIYDVLDCNSQNPTSTLNTVPSTAQSIKKVSFDFKEESKEFEDAKSFEEKKQNDLRSIGVILAQYGGCLNELLNNNNNFLIQKCSLKKQTSKYQNLSVQAIKLIEFILSLNNTQFSLSIQEIKEKLMDFQYYCQQGQLFSTEKRTMLSLMELNSSLQDNTHLSTQRFQNSTEKEQLIGTDCQLVPNSIERIIEFNFSKGKQLIKTYKDFLKQRKDNIDALISLGYLELRVNCNTQLANKYFQQTLQNSPNEIDAYYGMCECILVIKDIQNYNKVKIYTQVCLKIKNKDWRADYYNAWVDYESGNFQQAEENVDLALQKQKQQSCIYALKSSIVLKKGENEKRSKALICYAESLNLKNDPTIHLRRGIYYCHLNEYQKATQSFLESLKVCPHQFQTLIELIEIYKIINMNEKRQSLIDKMKQFFPQNYLVYSILGDNETNLTQQISYYQKSIELNPEQINLYKKIAEIHNSLNQPQESIKYYQILIEKNPKDSQSLYLCGKIYHYQFKNLDKANEFYLKAIEFDSQNTQILYEISNLYYQQANYEQSLVFIKKVKEINKNDERVHKFIAFLKLRNTNFNIKSFIKDLKKSIAQDKETQFTQEDLKLLNQKEAIKDVEDFLIEQLEQNTNKSLIYFLLGQIKIFKKDIAEAVNLLSSSLQIQPLEIKYNILIAQCYNSLGKYQISQYHYEQVLQQDESNLEALYQMGKIKYQEQNYELTIKFLNKMQTIDQEKVEAYFMLGESYLNKKRYSQSIQNFKSYINKSEEDQIYLETYKLLAKAYHLSGQMKLALENYYKYLETDTKNIQILNEVAELEQQTNNYQKSEEIYQVLLKLEPKQHKYKLKLGLLLKYMQQYEKSYNYLEQYLQIYQESIEARLAIASLQSTYKNNVLSAIKQYEKVLEQEPFNQEALLEISHLYEKNKQLNLAEKQIAKYLHVYPKDETGFILKAKLQMRNEKYCEALQTFQQVLAINPQNFMAFTNLGHICKILKSYDESEKYYEKCLEINHRYSVGYFEIAHLNFIKQSKLTNHEKIINYMESAIQFDPDNIQYFQFLEQVYLSQKNLIKKEVIQYLNSCADKCKSQHTKEEIQNIIQKFQIIHDSHTRPSQKKFSQLSKISSYLIQQKPSQQKSSVKLESDRQIYYTETNQILETQQQQQLEQQTQIDEQQQQQLQQQQQKQQVLKKPKKRYCNCNIF